MIRSKNIITNIIAMRYWKRYFKDFKALPMFLKRIVALIGGYLVLYAAFGSRHELTMSRASFERTTFIEMVSSSSKPTLESAMKNFSQIQNMTVPRNPSLWNPLTWLMTEKPNERLLLLWSDNFFSSSTYLCNHKEGGLNLSQADLRGVSLETSQITCANLRGAKLQKANLQGANLMSAQLGGANLEGANLAQANISGIKGAPIAMRDGKILRPQSDPRKGFVSTPTTFRDANMSGANLSEAVLRNAILTHANLRHANLTKAELSGADLSHAKLQNANFQGALLTATKLHGANLRAAKWLTSAQISQACTDENTSLPSAIKRPQPCP